MMNCCNWTVLSTLGRLGQLGVSMAYSTVLLDFLGTALYLFVFVLFLLTITIIQFDEYLIRPSFNLGKDKRLRKKALALAHVCSQVVLLKPRSFRYPRRLFGPVNAQWLLQYLQHKKEESEKQRKTYIRPSISGPT